jgi:plastocyanin
MKKIFLAILVLSALAAAFVIGSPLLRASFSQGTSAEVGIDNFSFTPSTITVHAGVHVRWTNRDDVPHTVVSVDKAFKSRALDTDEAFDYTFSKPGTYKYFCSLHPNMTATVVVN